MRRAKLITKATRRPTRGKWPPDPARVRSILEALEELYPDVDCELDRETPFQLVCATILSAQCTDDRVNMVTPELFRRFPTPEAMARAPLPTLEKIIRSTGFYKQKAKSLKGTAEGILTRFGGEIPKTIAELTTLPGVARKTANVVLGTAYGIAEGVVVDTHIQRLAMRLGLTRVAGTQGDRAGPDEGAAPKRAGFGPVTRSSGTGGASASRASRTAPAARWRRSARRLASKARRDDQAVVRRELSRPPGRPGARLAAPPWRRTIRGPGGEAAAPPGADARPPCRRCGRARAARRRSRSSRPVGS